MATEPADIETAPTAIVVNRRHDPNRRDTIATVTTAIVALSVILSAAYLAAFQRMGSTEVLSAWAMALTSTGATVVIRRNGK